MDALVSGQVAGPREGLATGRAGVGPVAGMGSLVSLQAAGSREGLAAGRAGIGAVSGMGAHVFCQGAGLRKGLAAGRAGVGSVSGMGALVNRQVAGLRESLTAGRASVGLVAGMVAHVSRQVAGLRGGFAADRAFKNVLYPRPIPPLLSRSSAALTRSTDTLIFPAPLVSFRRRISHLTYAGPLALLVKSDFACPSKEKRDHVFLVDRENPGQF